MLPVHHTQSTAAECCRAGPGHHASKPLTVPVHFQALIFNFCNCSLNSVQPMLVHSVSHQELGSRWGVEGRVHNHTQLSLEANLSVIER